MSRELGCEAGVFSTCGKLPTTPCTCCGLSLCQQHSHASLRGIRTDFVEWIDIEPAPKDIEFASLLAREEPLVVKSTEPQGPNPFYQQVMGVPYEVDNPCPECGAQVRERHNKLRCSNRECSWRKP